MEEVKNKICKFARGKNFLVVVLTYIVCVIFFDVILGICSENLWDELTKY